MTITNFGFYFEKAGLGAAQGAISPAEQFFEGSLAEESLVRETGQNSIDARAGEGPVTMVFQLADMKAANVPGIADLRVHLAQVEEETRGKQGHDSMLKAHQAASSEVIPVLRISDYGTKGLSGSESTDDPGSPLSALTRGAGISADDGSRGGSFGIGSAVGPMASNMNTVFYTSRATGSEETVLAGYSCLATHRDLEGTWRVGDGFYIDRTVSDDFRYLRNPPALDPFSQRTEVGTDTYILGYRKADLDPGLQHIKVAFMRNFLLAIHRGNLIVKGITGTSELWTLNKDTLPEYVKEDPQAIAFYRAINDPEPITTTSKNFGTISLWINIDDTLDRTLHTITTRTPQMKIDTFKHTSIPVRYAAVLECADEKGNTLLRALEPPQHNTWDPGRAPNGRSLLTELKTFVREGLKSRVKQQIGDQVEIKNLSRYLPAELSDEITPTKAHSGKPAPGEGSAKESATVQGSDGEPRPVPPAQRKTVRVGVQTAATNEGESPTSKGKNSGGEGTRKSKGGSMQGEGQEGKGGARITAGDIRFRSWSNTAEGNLYLALTATKDITGDLELVALGPGGTAEEGYQLPITESVLITDGVSTPITHEGNVLSAVQLKANLTAHVRIGVESGHRYRLGVK